MQLESGLQDEGKMGNMPVNFIVIDKCQQLKGGIVGTQRMGCRSHSKATGRGWRSSCRWPVRGSAHKEDGSPLRAESCLVPPVGPSYHFTFIEFVTTLLLFTFGFFGQEACGIFGPDQGSDLHPLHWKVKS